MWHGAPILFFLAALPDGSAPQVEARPTPVAIPTVEDYALVSLAPDAVGEATVNITRRGDTDQLDCTPTDIRGGATIAVASCRLVMLKLGWLPTIKGHDGRPLTIPELRIWWEPPPHAFNSDFGGATPIDPSGNIPGEPQSHASDTTSRYTTDLDASGKPVACRITASSGNRDHDETACLIAMGQSYMPAIDPTGTPKRTTVKSYVLWRDRALLEHPAP